MGKFIKFMDKTCDVLYNNPLERFLTDIVDSIHSFLNFYRSVYMIIGLSTIIVTLYCIKHSLVQNSTEFWFVFLTGIIIGALFITVARFAKDNDETTKE